MKLPDQEPAGHVLRRGWGRGWSVDSGELAGLDVKRRLRSELHLVADDRRPVLFGVLNPIQQRVGTRCWWAIQTAFFKLLLEHCNELR